MKHSDTSETTINLLQDSERSDGVFNVCCVICYNVMKRQLWQPHKGSVFNNGNLFHPPFNRRQILTVNTEDTNGRVSIKDRPLI